MSHILIDARIINSSTGQYMLKLLEYLQEVDKKNKYTVLVHQKDIDYWKPRSKRFKIVGSRYVLSSASEQTGLAKQIRSFKPDLVHFLMPQQPLVLGRIKRVTTVHDLTALKFKTPRSTKLKRFAYSVLLRQVARKSKRIITPTEYVRLTLAKFAAINSRKIVAIYEGVDRITESPEPIESVEGKKFTFFVGRSSSHKNLKRLVEAHKILEESDSELYLVFAGKLNFGYKRLRAYAKKLGAENVIFTDFVSEAEKRWLYEQAAAYVYPSLSEGFGLQGLEAMAHGCPLISSNATCLPEVYGDAAHYFDPTDVEEMASKIAEIVGNEKLRDKLREKGYDQAKRYSWKRMAEQTLAIYNEVLSS